MSMVAGFPWVDKTRRRSCHRRNEYDGSTELGVFGAERYYSTTESHGHHSGTKDVDGRSSTKCWRELGRASLDMAPHNQWRRHSQEAFLDTQINQSKDNDNKKKQKPSSPGAKLASFFNSLITQAVSSKKKKKKKKIKPSKSVEEKEDSLNGWRRSRSSISHFTSSTAASAASSTRPKRTSMSDFYAGFRTPPAPTIKHNNNICIANLEKQSSNLKGRSLVQESKEFRRFVEGDDGAESDSSSDLFELNLSYNQNRRHRLGYCGGDLPVYETTHMDGIKISSAASITNGPFKDS